MWRTCAFTSRARRRAASRSRRAAVGNELFRAECRSTARCCCAPLHYNSLQDQLRLRALLVSARPLLVSARPLLVSAPWMPEVPRLLSLGPVLLCQRARLPSANFKRGGGWKLFFPGIMQGYSRMLSRPTPLQQPTGPLQLWPCALRVATPWSLGMLDLDTLELR